MKKFFLGIIILITLITAFIAFMFYHEQSSGELVGRSVSLEWAKEAVGHGAGELLVTSIDRHGTGLGFDIELYKAIESVVNVPIIASGGAGTVQDFIDLFEQTGVTGALAASIFHFGEIKIPELKDELRAHGITVR